MPLLNGSVAANAWDGKRAPHFFFFLPLPLPTRVEHDRDECRITTSAWASSRRVFSRWIIAVSGPRKPAINTRGKKNAVRPWRLRVLCERRRLFSVCSGQSYRSRPIPRTIVADTSIPRTREICPTRGLDGRRAFYSVRRVGGGRRRTFSRVDLDRSESTGRYERLEDENAISDRFSRDFIRGSSFNECAFGAIVLVSVYLDETVLGRWRRRALAVVFISRTSNS